MKEKEVWEKDTEKCICPLCQKECIKILKEMIASFFENDGSCLDCLSAKKKEELVFAFEATRKLAPFFMEKK